VEQELIMELLGISVQRNLKYVFYLLMITMGVYFLNTLFIFYMNLKVVDYLPASTVEFSIQEQKTAETFPLEYYQSIWKRNLFSITIDDEENMAAADLIAQLDKLSLTSLNCTLLGTIINEGGNSWAIIKDNQSSLQDKYAVGSIVNGAEITLIMRNRVVLNTDGRDELLVMGIEKLRAEKGGHEKPITEGEKAKAVTYKISKDFVKDSINNVTQIMSNVRVKPHMRNGKPGGFQISRIKDDSIFKSMGFVNGDVIKSVNGQDIHTAQDIMGLYNTLKESNFFSIEIVRNNQAKTLNFKVR
jgi:general secretion pathway protein C